MPNAAYWKNSTGAVEKTHSAASAPGRCPSRRPDSATRRGGSPRPSSGSWRGPWDLLGPDADGVAFLRLDEAGAQQDEGLVDASLGREVASCAAPRCAGCSRWRSTRTIELPSPARTRTKMMTVTRTEPVRLSASSVACTPVRWLESFISYAVGSNSGPLMTLLGQGLCSRVTVTSRAAPMRSMAKPDSSMSPSPLSSTPLKVSPSAYSARPRARTRRCSVEPHVLDEDQDALVHEPVAVVVRAVVGLRGVELEAQGPRRSP